MLVILAVSLWNSWSFEAVEDFRHDLLKSKIDKDRVGATGNGNLPPKQLKVEDFDTLKLKLFRKRKWLEALF